MDRWDGGTDYDVFMGRWSRLVARRFVDDLGLAPGLRWLDVGCGTGALLEAVIDRARPSSVWGVDTSEEFIAAAGLHLGGKASVRVADGEDLPFDDEDFDVVVSGLTLNFIPDPLAAVTEWRRVTRQGGVVSAYVWDYAEGIEFLRRFWDLAIELNPEATQLDEALRFSMCRPDRLVALFRAAGLRSVEEGVVEVETEFTDFDDYWSPFLLGQGPAPSYVASLDGNSRERLEDRLRNTIVPGSTGTIRLMARAWTVTGIR